MTSLSTSGTCVFSGPFPPHPYPLPLGENSPKDSRIEPQNIPQKETPHPGPLPLGRGERESSPVHLRREVHGKGESQAAQLKIVCSIARRAANASPSPWG